MKSLLSQRKECYLCKQTTILHKHHVFGGVANRKISEREGCWVWLCPEHHNMGKNSVHSNKNIDIIVKKDCQLAWERERGTREEFMRLFGKNYLEGGENEERKFHCSTGLDEK